MSFTIQIQSPELAAAVEKARQYPTAMLLAIQRGMDNVGKDVLSQIEQERFYGQGPYPVEEHRLGVKTRRLSRSLRYVDARIEGNSVRAAMGSNVKYFAAHEFGFEGDVTVRAFSRTVSPSQFTKPGTAVKLTKSMSKKARKATLGTEQVSSHTRHMRMPARAPLGHGIADHLPDITASIVKELSNLWEKQTGQP